MPLDDVRVVFGERTEEPGRVFDEAGEEHHAQAERGGGHGRGVALRERGLDRGSVACPVRGSDDETAHAAVERGPDVLEHLVAYGELEEDVRPAEALRGVAGGGVRHAEDRQGWRAAAGECGGDRPTHASVTGDDAQHFRFLRERAIEVRPNV